MDLEKILLVASRSRYQCEIEKYGAEEVAREKYVPELWLNLKEGHLAQKTNLTKIKMLFHPEQIIDRSKLTSAIIDNYDAFVFLGGDNHFTYCSQILLRYLQENPEKQKAVFGVVLDPKRSWGGQLNFNIDDFINYLPQIQKNRFGVEKWTALQTVVKPGERSISMYPAINEIFAGETKRWMMSRNYVYLDGKEMFPDKSSGILIATGTGSGNGSWYDNVHAVTFGESDAFPRTADYARVILTEHKSRSKITLHKGQLLTIYSSNDDAGMILPDSHEERSVPFPMGAVAEVRVNSLYLPVVCR